VWRHRRPLSISCQAPSAGSPITRSRPRFSNDRARAVSGVKPKLRVHPAPALAHQGQGSLSANQIEEVRFATDSALEGDGFEPSVP
jgi:hypothetical protein